MHLECHGHPLLVGVGWDDSTLSCRGSPEKRIAHLTIESWIGYQYKLPYSIGYHAPGKATLFLLTSYVEGYFKISDRRAYSCAHLSLLYPQSAWQLIVVLHYPLDYRSRMQSIFS